MPDRRLSAWRASPLKTASRKSPTASSWFCSPPSAPATSAAARNSPLDRDNDKNPVVALREIAEETIELGRIEQDLIKSLSRAPEPEPADEEVLDLIPTDQNIFGLQDVAAEEEAAAAAGENEDISPEDIEAAIEAELGGRSPVAATVNAEGPMTAALQAAGAACRPPAPDGAARPPPSSVATLPPRGAAAPARGRYPQFELTANIRAYDPKADIGLIDAAYALAAAGARRRRSATTATPTSPIRSPSPTSWPATGSTSPASPPRLLHDVIEDTARQAAPSSRRRFGKEIAGLVDGVTKLTRLELQSDRTKQAENFRKLVLAMSRDIRVLLVKLADRLHNMRTLHFVPQPDRRQRIARETMEIYAPLAERIGMDAVKTELQTLAFAQLEPEAYATIQARLNFLRGQGADVIDEVRARTRPGLPRRAASRWSRSPGREKSPFSIWEKMQRRNVAVRAAVRHHGVPHRGADARRLLRGPGRGAFRLSGDRRALQGLHLDPEIERLPEPAHRRHAARAAQPEDRGADPHRRDERHRRERRRRALGLQAARRASTDGRTQRFRWVQDLLEILDNSRVPTSSWKTPSWNSTTTRCSASRRRAS